MEDAITPFNGKAEDKKTDPLKMDDPDHVTENDMLHGVSDVPPLHTGIILGLQVKQL